MELGTRREMEQWTGCIAGALTRVDFTIALHNALDDLEITRPTASTSTPPRR